MSSRLLSKRGSWLAGEWLSIPKLLVESASFVKKGILICARTIILPGKRRKMARCGNL
jgi:hypothetical protein